MSIVLSYIAWSIHKINPLLPDHVSEHVAGLYSSSHRVSFVAKPGQTDATAYQRVPIQTKEGGGNAMFMLVHIQWNIWLEYMKVNWEEILRMKSKYEKIMLIRKRSDL